MSALIVFFSLPEFSLLISKLLSPSDGSVFTAQVTSNPLQSQIFHTAQSRYGQYDLLCISAAMISHDKKSIQWARFGLACTSFPMLNLISSFPFHFRFSFLISSFLLLEVPLDTYSTVGSAWAERVEVCRFNWREKTTWLCLCLAVKSLWSEPGGPYLLILA